MSKTISNAGDNGTSGELVLVTGGSGFIGVHCILQLLNAGYRVRTTVRSLKREAEVRTMLKTGGAEPGEALAFFEADLTADAGWAEAIAGCDFVLHVASPFPPGVPKTEDELIIPACEGTLRVLRASRDAGIKRVVLTSSFAAVGYGHQLTDKPFTEETWSDPESEGISAYIKSKTLAERAAWDFIAREGGALELSVINPVGVFGPALGPDYSSSIGLLRGMMTGAMPAIPQIYTSVVDVRDVADLHLRAMTNPAAKGERFLAVAGNPMSFPEIAQLLKSRMGDAAERVPTKVLSNWVVRLTSLFKPSLKAILPQLGKIRKASGDKARRVLDWQPRSNEEAIIATAESFVQLELLKT